MRCVLMGVLLLMPAAGFAQNHPEWFECESDGDCVKTKSVCNCKMISDEAVNRDYAGAYDAWAAKSAFCSEQPKYSFNNYNTDCKYNPVFGPKAKAGCVHGKCAIVIPAAQEYWHNPPTIEDQKWYQCQSDDQCTVVRGFCYDIIVNKKFLEPAQEFASNGQNCIQPGNHFPKAIPACMNNECVASNPDHQK